MDFTLSEWDAHDRLIFIMGISISRDNHRLGRTCSVMININTIIVWKIRLELWLTNHCRKILIRMVTSLAFENNATHHNSVNQIYIGWPQTNKMAIYFSVSINIKTRYNYAMIWFNCKLMGECQKRNWKCACLMIYVSLHWHISCFQQLFVQ